MRKYVSYVGVKIPKEIEELLEEYCRILGISKSEFIRQLIIKKLEESSLLSTKIKEKV